MSTIITDNVLSWEAEVDRITRGPIASYEHELEAASGEAAGSVAAYATPRVDHLLKSIRALSSTSSSQPLLSASRVRGILLQSGLTAESNRGFEEDDAVSDDAAACQEGLESELEWVLVTKATVQAYGILLQTLLDELIPLNDDIWYWDEVLSSYANSSLYTLQTAPSRFWDWARDVFDIVRDCQLRTRQFRDMATTESLTHQWGRFWGIVRTSVADRSLRSVQQRIFSPLARCRADAKHSAEELQRLRLMLASGLGILVDEGLRFDADAGVTTQHAGWRTMVERSVSLLDQVTSNVLFESSVTDLEDKIFADVDADAILTSGPNKPSAIARKLDFLLQIAIPQHVGSTALFVRDYGRPSVYVRYWLPATAFALGSTTLLPILFRRRVEIIDWIRGIGSTVRDFWFNWVVEPITKIIGTIRHDANSEIAIMSRDSLKADRESLERMVVDFAVDKPQHAVGNNSISEAQIADIRAKVKEGDVTPVLRAYENDLRKPFMGAVKGDLVRSLLIQVQKTKVDLEVAISGIDALLKSQELVFGFVGLTPGVLVTIGVTQYLRGIFGGREGLRRGKKTDQATRVLRNIDRLFFEAARDPATVNGILSYKHRGLLVSEVHVLRNLLRGLLPGVVEKDFLQDMDDVLNAKPLERQVQALKRVRWAYAKWMK